MATDSARAPGEPTLAYRYRFGNAEFDESRFELRVGGLLVELQQKPLQVLALLLATPGEVVGKERIFSAVWNDRATGDAVLANAASKLRAALGEANADAIVTVPRSGYRRRRWPDMGAWSPATRCATPMPPRWPRQLPR